MSKTVGTGCWKDFTPTAPRYKVCIMSDWVYYVSVKVVSRSFTETAWVCWWHTHYYILPNINDWYQCKTSHHCGYIDSLPAYFLHHVLPSACSTLVPLITSANRVFPVGEDTSEMDNLLLWVHVKGQLRTWFSWHCPKFILENILRTTHRCLDHRHGWHHPSGQCQTLDKNSGIHRKTRAYTHTQNTLLNLKSWRTHPDLGIRELHESD